MSCISWEFIGVSQFHVCACNTSKFLQHQITLCLHLEKNDLTTVYQYFCIITGVDFSNAVLDRVNFEKANLKGAVFKNTVLSGSTFNDAQLEDANFEDTIIGYIDLQKLCTNNSISAEGRAELGCKWCVKLWLILVFPCPNSCFVQIPHALFLKMPTN